jgi:hypothetical protein
MKKILVLLGLLALFSLVIPAVATQYPLYAGQTIEVGYVDVTNSGSTLSVDFVITEPGWKIAQEHVAIATDPTLLPQKNGNPIPGKFPYSAVFDPPVEDTPPILIYGVTPGVQLYIAAHASLVHEVTGCTETVWMIGDAESYSCGGGTLLSNYMDEFNVMGSSVCALDNGYSPYQAPPFADPFVVGVNSDSEFPFMSDYAAVHNPVDPYTKGTERYGCDFDVQWNGALPFGGTLTVSWSPGQSATERKVISGEGIISTTFTAVGTPTPGAGWFLDKYPLVQSIVDVDTLGTGDHTIRFQHTAGDGTFWDWVKLERPCFETQTGWGAGTPFPGNTWATYITYTPSV